ncbi:hypothetical protein PRK78_005539 [Emydomyces testavorans]|uniref:Uncharacterized protein n=1 Tax=Emydomyces testavorans TaxID=2070801 RepID=A0AAF0IJL9_9EURO|nr:hypothetical protein PRK78_005539 [Emydomyces testavorans]
MRKSEDRPFDEANGLGAEGKRQKKPPRHSMGCTSCIIDRHKGDTGSRSAKRAKAKDGNNGSERMENHKMKHTESPNRPRIRSRNR